MKKTIAINGEFFARPKTGIERVAEDAVFALDKIARPDLFEIVVPKNILRPANFKNIKVVSLPFEIKFFPKWTQIHFQKYVIKNRRLPLDFSNTCPYFCAGFEFIHDIYAHLYKDDLVSSIRDRLVKIYSEIMYKRIAKKAKIIFTVSEYTKKTIVDAYKINGEKIKVVYSGVSGLKEIAADNSIFDALPQINGKEFYFTLGSLSIRKNLKWIAKHAELFPNEIFVISGKPLPTVVPSELEKMKSLKNVIMAGYLSDGQIKALYQKCKAFVFPSYFEGFGLPPLEALSCGAKIIIANSSCLPEIYGRAAYYIDPDEPAVDLEELLKGKVESPDALLEKFTFKKTAENIFCALEPYL